MEKNNLIGIVMATKFEAKPFIKNLNLKKDDTSPITIYSNKDIYLAISGVGKSNSAIATSYLINRYGINKLFNIGAAGSTCSGFNIGDILHIKKLVEYDRPKLMGKKIRYYKPDTLNNYKTATLATQDIPVIDPVFRKKVSKVADLVDMEGAAFVHACKIFKSKAYLFKIVTDTPEHPSDIHIMKNIISTRDSLFDFFTENILK